MTETAPTDPFFSALLAAPSPLLLTEKDVSALLQCSVRTLQQWRADDVRPPHWVALGQKLIRNPAHELVAWVATLGAQKPASNSAPTLAPSTSPEVAIPVDAGFDEPIFKGGRRRARQPSFHSFLTTGLSDDEWLFVCRDGERPVEFLEALTLEHRDDDAVIWLTLDEYLERIRMGALEAGAQAQSNRLDGVLPVGQEPMPKERLGSDLSR